MPHPASVPLAPFQKKMLPALLALAIFMQMLDVTVLNTALPSMARDLNTSALHMQSVIVSYVLTVAVCIPVSAHLSDRFGTRRIFMAAMFLFGLGSLLCALSSQLSMLLVSRVIQGMGGALLTPVARLVLMKSFRNAELLRVLNYAVMPALLGPILGPLVGGYLVQYASWHWIFLINLPFALLSLFFASKWMPNYTETPGKLDLHGFLLFTGSACLLTLGFELSGSLASPALSGMLILAGFLLLLGYKRHGTHKQNALYPGHLLSVRTYRIGLSSNLLSRIGMAALPFLLPMLFQISFAYSPVQSAFLLLPMAISAMAAKPFLHPLLNRFGYRSILLSNTILIGLLITALAFIDAQTSTLWISLHLLLLGAANSIQFSAVNTLTMARLRPYQKSSGNSLMAVNQQLAMGLGTAIGAMLLRYGQALFGASSVQTATTAFQFTFVIVGLITLSSAFLFRRLHAMDGHNMTQKQGA
ncbi:hypothetical protein N879_06235 [Alcaligenes sp. EGD-AK7]|nr:hypothetical protein N879_06235 [Alcaligenes sp. EGD-AK7]